MNKTPLISLITINFNGTSVTAELLQSLQHVLYPSIEIIVVDNASSEPPLLLKEDFPEVQFIFSKKNLGFAGGNNLGIRASKGDIVMLINNDTEVDPHFLKPIVDAFNSNPKIGCISSKLIFHDRGNIIQFAGHAGLHWLTGRGFSRGFGEIDKGQYDDFMICGLAHGAAMALKKEMIEDVGLMYENYFLYYEEVDYCQRIKNNGWLIAYTGKSKVYHKESMSVGKASPVKLYYLTRNRLLFLRRNMKGLKRLLALMFYLLVSYPKGFLNQLLNGTSEHRKVYIDALKWHLSNRSIYNQDTL